MGVKIKPKTYLVSWHSPHDAEGDWPHQARITASTVTRAIAAFHRQIVEQWNDLNPPDDDRPVKEWKNSEFPIVEVKVVA